MQLEQDDKVPVRCNCCLLESNMTDVGTFSAALSYPFVSKENYRALGIQKRALCFRSHAPAAGWWPAWQACLRNKWCPCHAFCHPSHGCVKVLRQTYGEHVLKDI